MHPAPRTPKQMPWSARRQRPLARWRASSACTQRTWRGSRGLWGRLDAARMDAAAGAAPGQGHTHTHTNTHTSTPASCHLCWIAHRTLRLISCVLRTIEMHAGTPLALVTAFQLLRDGGFSTAGYGGDRMAMDSIRTVLMDFVTNVGPSHHSVLSAPVDSEMPCIMPRDHHAACLITMSCCCER